MCTVQAPHWPWSQPFLVPVRPRCSRSASSSVVRISTFIRWRSPLMRIVSCTASRGLGAAADETLAFALPRSRSETDIVETTVVVRKLRRFQTGLSGDDILLLRCR